MKVKIFSTSLSFKSYSMILEWILCYLQNDATFCLINKMTGKSKKLF